MDPIAWIVPGPVHALVALLCGLWWAWTSVKVPGPVARVLRAGLVLWAAWAWAAATPIWGSFLVRALEDRYPAVDLATVKPDPRGTVIVLASGQMTGMDGRAWPVLDADGWERVRAGIALWRRTGGRLLMVGGPGHGATDALSGVMRQAAIEAGVPAADVAAAGGSQNTFEDLKAAAAWLGTRRDSTLWLVTSALHMPRAAAVAQALGLPVQAFPCGFRQLPQPGWRAWLPDNGDPFLWRDGLHETLGRAVYRARGWSR